MQCSGPVRPPDAKAASRVRASSRARGLTTAIELRFGPCWSYASIRGQVARDEPLAGEVARPESGVDLRDRRLLHLEYLCVERDGGRRERKGE